MAFYSTCPLCGANLDPGEPCDCQDERELEKQKIQRMLKVGKGGQMRMHFEQEVIGIAEEVVV